MTTPKPSFTLIRIIDPASSEGFGFESDWPSIGQARRVAIQKAREAMLISDEAEIEQRLAPLANLLPGASITVDDVLYMIKPAA